MKWLGILILCAAGYLLWRRSRASQPGSTVGADGEPGGTMTFGGQLGTNLIVERGVARLPTAAEQMSILKSL